MPERLVRESTGDRVPGHTLRATATTPPIIMTVHNSALQDSPIRRQTLPDGFEAELIETAERGQVSRVEGSVRHVEVFRMEGVGTSILEDLDPYPTNATLTPDTLSTAKSLEWAQIFVARGNGPVLSRRQWIGGVVKGKGLSGVAGLGGWFRVGVFFSTTTVAFMLFPAYFAHSNPILLMFYPFWTIIMVGIWRSIRGRFRVTGSVIEILSENTLRKNVVPLASVKTILIFEGIPMVVFRCNDEVGFKLDLRVGRLGSRAGMARLERFRAMIESTGPDVHDRILVAETSTDVAGLKLPTRQLPEPVAWVKPDGLDVTLFLSSVCAFVAIVLLGA